MSVVLDANAVIAYARQEEGWETVERRLDGAVLSTVTLGEVFRRGEKVKGVVELTPLLAAQGVRIEPLTVEHAWLQAQVPNTVEYEESGRRRRKHLGWGDRTVAALGLHLGMPVLTADRLLMALGPPYEFAPFR